MTYASLRKVTFLLPSRRLAFKSGSSSSSPSLSIACSVLSLSTLRSSESELLRAGESSFPVCFLASRTPAKTSASSRTSEGFGFLGEDLVGTLLSPDVPPVSAMVFFLLGFLGDPLLWRCGGGPLRDLAMFVFCEFYADDALCKGTKIGGAALPLTLTVDR